MPFERLTKTTIQNLDFVSSGQLLVRDTQLRGFGVRVTKQTKTYFVEGQVQKRTIRTTIGRADLMSPELARRKAIELLGDMASGINPNAAKQRDSGRTGDS